MANSWQRKPNNAATTARKQQYASRQHRAKVREYKALVAAGRAVCWRCGQPIPPGSQVHAGHDDTNRSVYRGPEHPSCNLTAAARKGGRMRHRPRAAQLRKVQRRDLLG